MRERIQRVPVDSFQYSIGLIPDLYFQDTIRSIQQFMPIWGELGLTLPDTSREFIETAIAESKQRIQ